jgi:hypothetical protein
MGNEPMLAYTVHHKGNIYPAGSTAADLGPVAAEIGAHAWEGGVTPETAAAPKQGEGAAAEGGTPSGEADGGEAPKKTTGGNRRSGNQGG